LLPPRPREPPAPERPTTVRVQAETPPRFHYQTPRDGEEDSYWYNDDDSYYNDDDSFDDARLAVRTANTLASRADPLAVAARNAFLANDRVYNKYAGVANPMTTLYLRQGALGAAFADATWLFSEPFADRPTALDDYLRCSTLVRACTPAEVLRRCTYEPRGSWYRER